MLAIALVLTLTPGFAPPEPDPTEALRRAEELYTSDRFGEAEPLYQAALKTDDRSLKRRAYEQLMALYVRSGRQDKAIRLAGPFRAWLQQVGDQGTPGELEQLLGECYFGLGHYAEADRHLQAALAATPTLGSDRKLEALRCRAEIAAQLRSGEVKQRWADLEAAAAEVTRLGERLGDLRLRVVAARYHAVALHQRGQTKAALTALNEAPDLIERLGDATTMRDVQRQRAGLLVALKRYAEAKPLFQEALSLQKKSEPKKRMVLGDILSEWSAAAQAAGLKDEAAKLRDEAAIEYRVVLAAPPSADPDGGGPLAAFAKLQALTRSARQFRKALELTRDAAERWSGDVLLDCRLKSDRGGLELLSSSYQIARTLLNQALVDADATEPPNLRALPQILVNLATTEIACETSSKAEALLDRCSGLYPTYALPDDPVRAECEYLRGVTAAQRGDFAGAMAFFRSGLAVCKTVGPPADPVMFNLWLNTALIYKEQGEGDSADDALRQAEVALVRFADADDLSFALIDAVRANLFVARGRVADAVALAPRIEAMCEKNGLKAGYEWSTARHVRALDLLVRRDLPAAEAIWKELAAAHRRESHMLLARTLNFLGICAEMQGRDADAAACFNEALSFQAKRPGSPPVTQAITLWRLGVLADKAGRKDEAKRRLTEVFDLADKARLNTFGEAAQRAQFFAQFSPAFELLVQWYARDGDGDGVLRILARSRSRTLLDQMLAAGVDPRAGVTGPNRAGLLARETAARASVSHLRTRAMLLPADNPNDPAVKQVIADLDAARKDYADAWREIVNADPVTRALAHPTFAETSLAKVRQDLPASGSVLLAYMLGRDESFAVLCAGPNQKPEVFRLTLPQPIASTIAAAPAATGDARIGLRGISIRSSNPQPERPAEAQGPAAPLTDLVASYLVDYYLPKAADPQFNPTRGISIVSTNPAQQSSAVTGEVLGDAVLPAALRARLKALGAKKLVVIPDGALHRLPLECLLISGGSGPRYAIDDLPAICYVPSPAILAVVLARPRATTGPPSLLTVGDPAYPEDKRPAATASAEKREIVAFRGSLPRLPYTAVESRRIQEFFPADQVTALEGEQATKKNVVASIAGKRFVHLAAHGFADDSFGNLFAAVALAKPAKGPITPDDDGFLSLYEIYRLPLTGCELTVLSACVTNVGPQRPLEAGVTLGGAFLCAGSRGVMATCWSVDDKATAEMMAEFFKTVNPTGSKPASYADALKTARQRIRSRPGWESPFFWAPFVLLGPPD